MDSRNTTAPDQPPFHLAVTEEEQHYLRTLARLRINQALKGEAAVLPPPPGDNDSVLRASLGAFVTITLNTRLRGCIGTLTGNGPLYKTVAAMAESAAFKDPRFPPLSAEEFPHIEIEISIMGPITPCPDPEKIIIGRHGLIIRQGSRQGLLLPQVPVEWGWDRTTFLTQTCRKAGLPPNAWREPGAVLFWFEADIV
jgi:AmmeMemoRadiSam system protein A